MGFFPIILGNHAHICPFAIQKVVKWAFKKLDVPRHLFFKFSITD